MSQTVTIKMLGGLRAETETQAITRFSTQKTGALLAYLAYFAQRTHPRETLVALLWPHAAPQAGRASLSVALSSLRHQLEPPDMAAGTVLRAERFAISLHPDAIATDVAAFERELDAAEQAENQTTQMQHLQAAVNLYRGPLLPGYYEDWIPAEQERLADRYLHAVRRLIRHETKARALQSALDYARQAVQAAPLREETHQDLMRLLLAVGQPAAALQQYHALETLFHEELNSAPSAISRKLAREIEGVTLSVPAPAVPPAAPAPPAVSALPGGIVTFLFTDIEKSTALWEQFGDAFKALLAAYHALLRREFRHFKGHEAKEAGDSFLVAFARPADALQCAIHCQRLAADKLRLPEREGTPSAVLRIRMALHTGEAEREGSDYRGFAIHRASRLLSAGHGGQILCSETTASLLSGALDADTRLLDLGIFRLRDLPQPERLFQVIATDLEQRTFPPPAAEAGYAGNLPLQFTRFFGREEELGRWRNLLAPEAANHGRRLFTLLGPGGTGKTRLAIEAARQAAPAFRGAVWFAPLADVSHAKDIPAAIADALRLPRLSGLEPIEQIADALNHQSSLLVLDNFEQIITEGAAIVQTLLSRIPSLVCLITSRQKLDIEGEQSFPLAPLPILPPGKDAASTAQSLLSLESARMFVERAQAVRPDFQLTDGNAPAIAALCRALEGIPLAIELAAARASVLTPSQMLAQLARRFDFLVSKRKDRAERHRTLRGAIEWSFRLLSPEQQTFFGRLGVLRGGWTLEAAEAVCNEPLALDYLAELQECSLVIAEEVGEAETGEMRFRMLETLREFAEAIASPEEKQAAQVRHREYFLEFARTANANITGPEQIAWLARLERDHENLRAAVRYCDDAPETHLRLVSSLWKFWEVRGHYREAAAMYAEVLARPDAHTPSQPLATVYNSAANMAYHQGDYAAAGPLYEESLRIARLIEHPKMTAIVLGNMGNIASDRGDFAAARALYEESLAIKRDAGVSPVNEATTLSNIGNLLLRQGNLIEARTYYEEALRLYDSAGDASGRVIVLHAFGVLDTRENRFDTACAHFRDSLLLCRELGERLWTALSLEGLAHVATRTHQSASAVTLYHAAMALRNAMGTPIEPDEAILRDSDLTALRESFAPDLFTAASAAGRTMTWEDAIAYALATLDFVH